MFLDRFALAYHPPRRDGGTSDSTKEKKALEDYKKEAQTLKIYFGDILQAMCELGKIKFYSAKDLSRIYGKSRQWWEKLMRTGEIKYQRTSSGKITTNFWVEEYLKNKNGQLRK